MPPVNNKQQFYEKHNSEISNLCEKFEGYMIPITKDRIKDYLCQFELNDKAAGLKLLQKVDYYSNARVSSLVNELGMKLRELTNQNFNNVYFCPTNHSSGSSADTIIRKLRNFLQLGNRRYDSKFIYISDLGQIIENIVVKISLLEDEIQRIESLPDDAISKTVRRQQISELKSEIEDLECERIRSPPKTIIFVDDYVGSGNSFKEFWYNIGTLLNENCKFIFAVLIAHQQGKESIEDELPIKLIMPTMPIPHNNKIFHNENPMFTEDEKITIKKYCDSLGLPDRIKYGFMNTQAMVVIYERTPNNTLPILHARTKKWEPLFPRQYEKTILD